MSFKDDLEMFRLKLNKAMDELISNKVMKEMGDEQVKIIRTRSRLGYGVPVDGGGKKKFEKLMPSTISRRANNPELSGLTGPSKSNLTETGELLDDLVAKIENRQTIITHSRERNKQIGALHQSGSGKLPQRRYLGLANTDIKQVRAFMQDKFTEILKRLFK